MTNDPMSLTSFVGAGGGRGNGDGGGFTRLSDMFDGGGMGGSGSALSSKSHEDYMSYFEKRHGHGDPSAKSHADVPESGGGSAAT